VSEKQVPEKPQLPIEMAYQIKRDGSGYCLYQLHVQGTKVISKAKASEEDVLLITVSHLEKAIRKDYGL